MNGKKLARLMESVTGCITQLSQENEALRSHLKRITAYDTVERLRAHSGKDWGLSFEEALEMAYENVITEARNGLAWKPAAKITTTEKP
jgi:uncharacterized secreted protein with C-terminal beta-propeller domain